MFWSGFPHESKHTSRFTRATEATILNGLVHYVNRQACWRACKLAYRWKNAEGLIRGGFSCGDALLGNNTEALVTVFQAGSDESREERVRRQRLRFEFRVKLAAHEPRMVRRLHNFHVHSVRRASGDAESGSRERFLILAVKFVTMPVPLGNFSGSVRFRRKGTRLQFAGPRAQPHRSAHFIHAKQFAQLVD